MILILITKHGMKVLLTFNEVFIISLINMLNITNIKDTIVILNPTYFNILCLL